MALIADLSLGSFLVMSLMSLQLWTLIDLAGPIFTILGAQFVGRRRDKYLRDIPGYGPQLRCGGGMCRFGGISLGSTPTAMANMSAVTQRFGASNLAFIVVPLVCAFFIDLANAVLIPFFLANF